MHIPFRCGWSMSGCLGSTPNPKSYPFSDWSCVLLQEKEGKVAYLTKVIAVVSLALNQPVPAKPLKVIIHPWQGQAVQLSLLARTAHAQSAADTDAAPRDKMP
eukprot:GHUV01033417.1.p2 GENE.GHUV01033417.1~~GHUV01033417.1.p2  ORF type:complete len:103 (-),score=18.34 GHUV01033417.1:601-909(-)